MTNYIPPTPSDNELEPTERSDYSSPSTSNELQREVEEVEEYLNQLHYYEVHVSPSVDKPAQEAETRRLLAGIKPLRQTALWVSLPNITLSKGENAQVTK